jgi:hypothetical protein
MAGEVEVPLGQLGDELRVSSKLVFIKDTMARNLVSRGASEEEITRECDSQGRNLHRMITKGKWKNKTWNDFKSSEEGQAYLAKPVRFELAGGGEAVASPGAGFEVYRVIF